MSSRLLTPLKSIEQLFKKPHTIKFPEEKKEISPIYRGFHINDRDKCIGCGNCRDICPVNAINMVEIKELKNKVKPGEEPERPAIDYGRCCFCALCVDICPTSAMNLSQDHIMVEPTLEKFNFVSDESRMDRISWTADKEESLVDFDRYEMPIEKPEKRVKTFDEMVLGFPEEIAVAEANRCLECGECVEACPAHMDIPEYIRAIAMGDNKKSVEIMLHTNPFMMTCGRICTHACETACSVEKRGEPVAIRWLKRFAADKVDLKDYPRYNVEKIYKKPRVAIIGAGPAGLSAAFYLSINGIIPTIYERHPKPGGMLRYGVPPYRLNDEQLDKDINYMLSYGTKVKYNTMIGEDVKIEYLLKHFDIVYLAIGLQAARALKFPHYDHKDVLSAVDFLEKVNMKKRIKIGKDVLVIGGGNVAMDVARSSARLQKQQYGRVNVKVMSLESMEELPALEEEIEEALEEGIKFIPRRSVTEPIIKNKKITGVETIKVTSVFDEEGRFAPHFDKEDKAVYKCDMIIQAIGQMCPFHCLDTLKDKLKLTNQRKVDVTDSYQTSIGKVYAGGDIVNFRMDAVSAIATGREFAFSIVRKYLKKEPFRGI